MRCRTFCVSTVFLVVSLLLVLVSPAKAQLTPPVVEQVEYASVSSLVQVAVTVSNLPPNSWVTRRVIGYEQPCLNTPGYTVDEFSYASVPTDAYGRLTDTFVRTGCSFSATVTYTATDSRAVTVAVRFNVFTDFHLFSPIPNGYMVGAIAELTTEQVLYFFPLGHHLYDGQVEVLPRGLYVVTINGPVQDATGAFWYQVRTLEGVWTQQGWVRDSALRLIDSPVSFENPAANLNWYLPQGMVPDGSLRINVRPFPTVRRDNGSPVAPPVGQLEPGQVVHVTGQTSNGLWLSVQSLDGTLSGWVCSHFLLVNFDHPYLANNHPQRWYIATPPVSDPIFPPEDCSGQVQYPVSA